MIEGQVIGHFAAIIGGVGSFIGGLAAFLNISKTTQEAQNSQSRQKSWSAILLMVIGCLLLMGSAVIYAITATRGGRPLNEELTTKAWEAYRAKEYEKAIKFADECINEFKGAAKRKQTQLEQEGSETPNGTVSEEDKAVIFSRGLLNDVATCMYVKGRSLEALGKISSAKTAYEVVSQFTHARTWDPKGWFWSPAESALDRIANMDE